MLKSLYSKLAFSLALVLLLVGLFYAVVSQSLTERSYLSGNQQLNRELAADLAREMQLVKNGLVDLDAMSTAFHTVMLVNPSVEVYFLDPFGNIVDYSADSKHIKREQVSLEPIKRFIAGESMYPLMGDDPRNLEQQKSFSVAAVPDETDPQGYLYVVLQSSAFDQLQMQEQSRTLQTLGYWTLGGSLLIGLLLGLLVFYKLTRRIRRLSSAMDDFRDNGFSDPPDTLLEPVSRTDGDEVSQLIASFDAMAAHINQQYSVLEKQDQMRREMIANVSHDLRTPLAAIHGYIERLRARFHHLPEEERRQYLDISLRHSVRLKRLIDDLFELSKLEAHDIEPNLEPFLLTELVQDVLQKFRLRADKKEVKLRFEYAEQLPQVNADLALMDRALSNLVDNAIRHTDKGGYITLVVDKAGEKVSVQVQDNGRGIADQHIKSIFQRFYRADKQHRGSDKHAGLGLAITRRIVELHGEAINVRSKLDHGTTFEFFMPVWKNTAPV